jgi:DNA-binding beta-propeller fold protein YncE
MSRRAVGGAILATLAAAAVAGCGSHTGTTAHRHAASGATASTPAKGTAARRRATVGARLHVVGSRSLPAPIQLPGLARVGTSVLAVGGLNRADGSVADIVRVAPGAPRRVGALPAAIHDVGAAALGSSLYVFGGGSAGGPTAAITQVAPSGSTKAAGRLPMAMSDTTAVTMSNTAYVIGGYTTTTPLRSVLAFRPGRAPREVAVLPHPVRYAAAAAVGGRLLVAGGTDGTRARDEIVSVDPVRHRARVIGHLPGRLAHAAGAALGGTFYVVGGRGDGAASQRRGIWAIDPASGHVRPAGRLPTALSDLAAAAAGSRLLVAGGRDAHAGVHRELLELARSTPRTVAGSAHAATVDVYAATRAGHLAPQVRGDPARVYVPNSQSDTVDVIDQRTARIVDHFAVGALPQHVTPSWDLRTLWVTNDTGNSLTPIDPRTGRHGRPVPVRDPYNLYFTADGRRAIVVAEAHRALDFREPHTMRLVKSLDMPTCAGADHMDFTADGRLALVSCEFAGRMVVVDLRRERVVKAIDLKAGAMPQDVKLSPDGRTFYVADMASNGVWLIDARRMSKERFQPTGRGAHGLYPSRDAKLLYVSNRGAGTITLISFRTRRPVRTWRLPGGGSPDMGGVSADGRVLWLSGRYNSEVYAISTSTGHLLHRIHVGQGPHGLCVWPQPGRYSIGHTGILR